MPGGSAGTSFCSGTEMSISLRAMAWSPVVSLLSGGRFDSDRLDAGLADDLAPFRHFVVDAPLHAVGTGGGHLEAIVGKLLGDLGPLENFDGFFCQQIDHIRRCLGGSQQALERIRDKVLV